MALNRSPKQASTGGVIRGLSGPPAQVPAPSGLTRFIVDSSYTPQSETSIASDPSNSSRIVGGFNDGRAFFCPNLPFADCPDGYQDSISGFSVSVDGGTSVLKSGDLPGISATETNVGTHTSSTRFLASWGDPWVLAGPGGVFYYSALAFDNVTGANGVMVAKSNSNLWNPSNTCATPGSDPSTNPCWTSTFIFGNLSYFCNIFGCGTTTFEDKDAAAIDMNPSSPYYGQVYVAWDHFNADGTSSSYLARCSPSLSCQMLSGGGQAVVSGTDKFAAFSAPVVSPSGAVHMAWCNFGTAKTFGPVTCNTRASAAGGGSFGTLTTIMSFMGAGTNLPGDSALLGFATEQFRASSDLTFAAGPPTSPNDLYFAIAVCTSGSYYAFHGAFTATDNPGNCGFSSVFFQRSTDGGATWSNPTDISDQAVVVQPTVAVDSSTGKVFVAYYSTQYDEFNHRIDVVVGVSQDRGVSWSHLRDTSVSNEPNADPSYFDYNSTFGGSLVVPQYGDYFSATAQGGRLLVLFTGNYATELGTTQMDPFLVVSGEAAPSLTFIGGIGAGPGSSVGFNASGLTPATTFQLSIDWSGQSVILASGTVPQSGTTAGNFTVPNVQSQVYTATVTDARGNNAEAPLGIGQTPLGGLSAGITSLQSELSLLGRQLGTVNGTLGSISTHLDSLRNSLTGQVSSLNSSVTALGSQVGSSFSDLQGRLSSTQAGSALIEYLVMAVIVLSIAILAWLAVGPGKKRQMPTSQAQPTSG